MQEGAADPGLYDARRWPNRARIQWPGGKSCAVWVSPNLEYYEIDPPKNPHRASWTKPHPDVVGYSHRDHANIDQLRLIEDTVPLVGYVAGALALAAGVVLTVLGRRRRPGAPPA